MGPLVDAARAHGIIGTVNVTENSKMLCNARLQLTADTVILNRYECEIFCTQDIGLELHNTVPAHLGHF